MNRFRTSKSIHFGLAACVAAAIAAGAIGASGAFSAAGPLGPLATVSNVGTPFTISDSVKQHMGLTGYSSITQLAVTNGQRYLRFAGNSNACYGNGSVTGALPVGIIKCDNGAPFPSTTNPILDLSVVQVNADGTSQFVRVGGVAANGVAHIGILNAAGNIVQTIPVVGNIYDSSAIASGTVAELVALDASGNVVAHEPSGS